jgi:hypothetical protein
MQPSLSTAAAAVTVFPTVPYATCFTGTCSGGAPPTFVMTFSDVSVENPLLFYGPLPLGGGAGTVGVGDYSASLKFRSVTSEYTGTNSIPASPWQVVFPTDSLLLPKPSNLYDLVLSFDDTARRLGVDCAGVPILLPSPLGANIEATVTSTVPLPAAG